MSFDAGAGDGGRQVRLPKTAPVKNRQPAAKQITAEQILRESKALQAETSHKTPVVVISDPEELREYHLRKRKEHEDDVRRVGRWNRTVWIKYAQWEEQQGDLRRARSVWERCLELFHREPSVWLRYAEMEMRHRCVNAARNVWDRATSLLPRVDQLWWKYAHMEEVLGEPGRARSIMERWVSWEPDHHGWLAYAKLELRHGEVEAARAVYERYVRCLPCAEAFERYAKFEASQGGPAAVPRARAVYERGARLLEGGDDAELAGLITKFADFEAAASEPARARALLRAALARAPDAASADALRLRAAAFERAHGDADGADAAAEDAARARLEARLASSDRFGHDAWFDLARLEEGSCARACDAARRSAGLVGPGAAGGAGAPGSLGAPDPSLAAAARAALDRVRETYERAVADLPRGAAVGARPLPETPAAPGGALLPEPFLVGPPGDREAKRPWRRYVYLWLRYAAWEELAAGDRARARAALRQALATLPSGDASFGKVWVSLAQLEVRSLDLAEARRALACALLAAPRKPKLHRALADLEAALGNAARCRRAHEAEVAALPDSGAAWARLAALEQDLGEDERCRAACELALARPRLDAPELVWKRHLDHELSLWDRTAARALYERLAARTNHPRVWLSWAAMEAERLDVLQRQAAGDEPGGDEPGGDEPAADPTDGTEAEASAAADETAGEGAACGPGESVRERESRAREVYARAFQTLRERAPEDRDGARAVLDAWGEFEEAARGARDEAERRAWAGEVAALRPKRVKRRRPVLDALGEETGRLEEFHDWIFPDEQARAPDLRLLKAAYEWKRRKLEAEAASRADASADVGGAADGDAVEGSADGDEGDGVGGIQDDGGDRGPEDPAELDLGDG